MNIPTLSAVMYCGTFPHSQSIGYTDTHTLVSVARDLHNLPGHGKYAVRNDKTRAVMFTNNAAHAIAMLRAGLV